MISSVLPAPCIACSAALLAASQAMKAGISTITFGVGWSQGELARRLGVSRQTINAVETDKYDPSLPLALRMARLFGLEVRELFIDHWMPEVEG